MPYTGERDKHGDPEGEGRQTWPNGDTYVGQFKGGRRHGQGTYTLANGERYEGPYLDDKRHGLGTYFWPNGDKFEGNYHMGRRHGQGTLTWADQSWFKGPFVNDRREGDQCEVHYENGDHYQGAMRDGERHGEGRFVFANADTYTGQFQAGKQHGEGTLVWRKAHTKMPAAVEPVTPAVREAFERIANGSGKLDFRELQAALQAMGKKTSEPEGAALLAKYDYKNSGLLELAEFNQLVNDMSSSSMYVGQWAGNKPHGHKLAG